MSYRRDIRILFLFFSLAVFAGIVPLRTKNKSVFCPSSWQIFVSKSQVYYRACEIHYIFVLNSIKVYEKILSV